LTCRPVPRTSDLDALGCQIVGHVPALLHDTTLYDGVLGEDALEPGGERLGAVDDAEQSLPEAKPSVYVVGQEVLDHRGVLGVAFPDPDRDLGPIGRDRERDDTAALLQDDAVDHEQRGSLLDRSELSSSASFFSLPATKRLEITDLESPRATISGSSPMGSPPERMATPANPGEQALRWRPG